MAQLARWRQTRGTTGLVRDVDSGVMMKMADGRGEWTRETATQTMEAIRRMRLRRTITTATETATAHTRRELQGRKQRRRMTKIRDGKRVQEERMRQQGECKRDDVGWVWLDDGNDQESTTSVSARPKQASSSNSSSTVGPSNKQHPSWVRWWDPSNS